MSLLNHDEILGADDIQFEVVSVPEWGGDVRVKGMTGQERDEYEGDIIRYSTKKKPGEDREALNLADMRAKLCSFTIVDEDGKRLFSEKDVRKLTLKSAAALQRVFKVAQELSGITDEDLDELAEELEESPFEDSASFLPDTSDAQSQNSSDESPAES